MRCGLCGRREQSLSRRERSGVARVERAAAARVLQVAEVVDGVGADLQSSRRAALGGPVEPGV